MRNIERDTERCSAVLAGRYHCGTRDREQVPGPL